MEVTPLLSELERRGVATLLVEGGGSLVGWLLEAGVVDELCVTLCPLVLGSGPSLVSGGWTVAGAPRFTLAAAHPLGDELYTRWVR